MKRNCKPRWYIDWEFWVCSKTLVLFSPRHVFVCEGSAETIIPLAKKLGASVKPSMDVWSR